MLPVRRDKKRVSATEPHDLVRAGKREFRCTFSDEHPLGPRLVVPLAGRRDMAFRDNALDANAGMLDERKKFLTIARCIRQSGEEIHLRKVMQRPPE